MSIRQYVEEPLFHLYLGKKTTMIFKSFLTHALLAVTFLFVSCGGEKTNEENVKQDPVKTALVMDPAIEKMLGMFSEAKPFPVLTDTVLMNNLPGDTLTGEQVKQLQSEWLKHDLVMGVDYDLNGFYTIDSAKAKGAYAKWCEGLDIGMMKFATAHPLNQIKLDDKTVLLTWALETSSYEACPYFSGTAIYATLIYEGKPSHNFILGEQYGAGDPPSGMTRVRTSELTADGKLHIMETEESSDMDEEVTTTQENEYWFEIKDGKFVFVKDKKGKERGGKMQMKQ